MAPTPTFNKETSTISLPEVDGVEYSINGRAVSDDVEIEKTTVVSLSPKPGYVFAKGKQTEYKFYVDPDSSTAEVVGEPHKGDVAADAVDVTSPGNTPESPTQGTARSNTRWP